MQPFNHSFNPGCFSLTISRGATGREKKKKKTLAILTCRTPSRLSGDHEPVVLRRCNKCTDGAETTAAAPSSRSAQISISQHLLYLQCVCGQRSNSARSLKMHAARTPTLGVRRVQLSHPASLQWQLIKVGSESPGFAAPHTSLRPAAGGSLHSRNHRSTGCSLDLMGFVAF